MKRLLTLLFAVGFSTTMFCQAFDWQWQNAKPHSNELRAVKIIAPNTIVGFASAGVVQKSTDNGITWNFSYVDPSRRAFRSADFVNALVGYACGEGGLLMKTTDGGDSFTSLVPGTTNYLYDIDFVDADTGYVGGASGLLIKTTDGGANWTTITTGFTNTINAVSVPVADTVYFGTSRVSSVTYIKRSTDYGVTWQSVVPTGYTGETVWDICFLNGSRGWFVYQYNGGVYRTTNGGSNWTLSNTTTVVVNNSVTFKDTITGYITDNIAGSVYKSTDGGATWTGFSASPEPQYATDYSGSTVFSAGRAGTCYKSTDGGSSYTAAGFTTVTTTQIRQIRFLNESVGLAGVGSSTVSDSSGYLVKTTDGGNTWTALPYNFKHQVNSLWLASDSIWYVGRGRNAIFKTTDAGTSFVQQTQPVTGTSQFYDIGFVDLNNGYAFNAAGGIAKTTDGGTNWTNANSPFASATLYSGYVFSSSKVIAVGSTARAYITTNGGTNWSPLTTGTPGNFFVVRFYDASVGVIAGFNSPNPVATKTTDGGNTWTPLTLPSPSALDGASIWGIGFKSASVFWLTAINGVVAYTTDGGSTWTIAKKVTANTVFSAAIVGNHMWLSGDRGTILKGYSSPSTVQVSNASLTALIEGFYTPSIDGTMVPDTVTVELHNATSPYALVDQTKTVLDASGNATATFLSAADATNYYIAVNHRNSIGVWSKNTQQFSGGALSYNFTTAATQAYGDNLVNVGGKWCLYSGDVVRDEFIDGSDVSDCFNDASIGNSGYVITDLTGDDFVDGTDVSIAFNNASIGIGASYPTK